MELKVLPHQLKKQISEIKNDYFYPSLKSLKGNILEIGFGKGENFSVFSSDSKIFAIEKNEKFLNDKKTTEKKNIILKKGETEKMPFENDFFDAVVASFVLCSVYSVEKSFEEIYRVLKKGGKVVLLEHIKSENKMTMVVQKIITGIQSFFISCHLDRDPRLFIDKQKFEILSEKVFENDLEPYLFMELKKI